MVHMTAVSNATPLIYLAKATHLDILRKTYKKIYVCTDVWKEVIRPILYARPIPKDVPIILQARADGWIIIKDVETSEAMTIKDKLIVQGFGKGESSSIALAKELNTLFLANDESAISAAKQYNIENRWVTEILHDAMKANHIKSVKEYIKVLDDCINHGLYVSKKQRDIAVQKAQTIILR